MGFSMDLELVLTAVVGLLVAGVVKGATGLGYASCALPFLVLATGLKTAMAIVIIPALATNVGLAFMSGHFREIATRFRPLYVAILPGIAVGVLLLHWISQSVAVKTLGIIIISYVALALLRPEIALSSRQQKFLQVPTGLLNGLLTGLTGSQVMPLFPFVMSLKLDPDRTVQAINIAVMISTSFLAVGLFATGILTVPLLLGSALAVAPAIAGTFIGNGIRPMIPVARFRQLVLVTLLLVGGLMLFR